MAQKNQPITQAKANEIFYKLIKDASNLGLNFSNSTIWQALSANNFKEEQTLDQLLTMPQQDQNSGLQRPETTRNHTATNAKPVANDNDFMSAITASLKHEPLDIEKRYRRDTSQVPVGLKNVGNTCYFNSLLQALFWLPNIRQKILQAQIPGPEPPKNGSKFSDLEMRQQCCRNMVGNIQRLFAQFLTTN